MADRTTHSCRAVIVHLKLHPHLPMSTGHEGFDVYNIRQFFHIAAGVDASSSLGPWFRSVSLGQPSVTSPFYFSFPMMTLDQRVQLVCDEFQLIRKH